MKYIVKIPPVSFSLGVLLGNSVSVNVLHFVFLWLRLPRTLSFPGAEPGLQTHGLHSEMILWTASISMVSTFSLCCKTHWNRASVFTHCSVLLQNILNYYLRCFTICGLRFSLHRPLHLIEHCRPHPQKPLSFQGPGRHTLLIVCVLLMSWLSLCGFIRVPALRGLGCFSADQIFFCCDFIRSEGFAGAEASSGLGGSSTGKRCTRGREPTASAPRSVSPLTLAAVGRAQLEAAGTTSADLGSQLCVGFQALLFWEGPGRMGSWLRGHVLLTAGHQRAGVRLSERSKESA